MRPVVLNALHVPLVYDDNNFLLGALVDSLEQVIITLVNDNALDSGEEDV